MAGDFKGIIKQEDGFVKIYEGNIEVSSASIDYLGNDVLLEMTIVTKNSSIRGRDVIKKSIEYIEKEWEEVVTGFKVNWKKAKGISDNIDPFNIKVKSYMQEGLSETKAMEKAYWETFSGKMARENGFSQMKEISGIKGDGGDFISIEAIITQ